MSSLLAPTPTLDTGPTVLSTPTETPIGMVNDFSDCKIVGAFSIFIQALVGTLGFSTLIIKRHFESPRRTWLVWSFDVGKQAIGGGIMHAANLIVSALSGSGNKTYSNPCSWYVLNLTLDCTLGVAVFVGFMKLFEKIANHFNITDLQSGDYGNPPSWIRWLKQGSIYCLGMICMKMVVVFMIEILPFLVKLGDWILAPVKMTGSSHFEIIFVMAIWPLILNIFESWVIDHVIKARKGRASGHIPLQNMEESFVNSVTHPSSTESRTLGGSRAGSRLSIDLEDIDFGEDSDGATENNLYYQNSTGELYSKARPRSPGINPSKQHDD